MVDQLDNPETARRPITWRSVTLGLAGVVAINVLTPFNNLVLGNTDMVGSYLPTGLTLLLFMFVLLVNAPLHRWFPRRALSSGELAVAFAMALVSCALPFVGLMRYLPGHLVGLFNWAGQRTEYAQVLRDAHLSPWLFPTMASSDPAARANDPVVREYLGRAIVAEDTFLAHFMAVPWSAWLVPAIMWGIFLVGLFGSILCLMVILRRQWVENERLQFPLATVYASLIEPPPAGRALNRLLSHRGFWIAFAAIFCLHLANGLSTYLPREVPRIPLDFALNSVLTEEPWRYSEYFFKTQTLYFTIVGLMMFIQTRTAFSLWFVFFLVQLVRMLLGVRQQVLTDAMEFDQLFGAVLVFAAMILWVARHHLAAVLRHMLACPRSDDPQGRYLPYSLAGWGFLACQALLVIWLWCAGSGLLAACITVAMLFLLYLVLARIVADTGMIYALIPLPLTSGFDLAASAMPQLPRAGVGSYFFASLFSGILTHDLRQALPPYAQHALAVNDRFGYERVINWRKGIGLIGLLALSLAVAYLASGASMLYMEYNHAATLDRSNTSPINSWGTQGMPQAIPLDWTVRYAAGRQNVVHDRWMQVGIGATITGFCGAMRLATAGWPIHPAGFLLCYSWGLRQIWFSIFIGWLAKVLLLRLGGSRLFTAAQPIFIGLIMGEVMAAAWWLCVSLALASMGLEYRAISLLP